MKIGMLSFAHVHSPAYAQILRELPDAELVAIADDDRARGEAAAREYGAHYYDDFGALLARGDVAAVVVCAPNVQHRALTVAAAEAGKHVLCEKPLATTRADGEAMIAACRRAGVQLMTAFPMRFSPPVIAMRAMVRDGAIGEVLAVNGTNHGSLPPGWLTDPALAGGGAVMDHTVHVADLLRCILQREFTSVYAEIDTLLHPGLPVDDCATLLLELEGGVFASLDPSWSRPRTFPTWGDVTLEVVGARGVLWLDAFAQRVEVYSDVVARTRWGGDIGAQPAWEGYAGSGDPDMIRAFVAAVREGGAVPVTGEDGLRAAEVALAAYESARTGQPVPVSTVFRNGAGTNAAMRPIDFRG
ncbi:MAG TPA: Gfo/Idh/MocA family oxidoreductase [Vicinamibacteria bacterium]